MARQFNHLFDEIASFASLYAAFRRAAKGKRGHREVVAFEADLEAQLLDLQQTLRTGAWRPGPYRSFHIHEGKARLVSAAPFADRVVHHALIGVIEPLFEPTFIADSYANRKGRGTHAAVNKLQAWTRRYDYALTCDLKQFFPSIDHEILLGLLARKITCAPTLELCRLIIASGDGLHSEGYSPVLFPGDDLLALARPVGLPIGNLTSQFWANVLLNELDQFIKRRLRWTAYLRYVDDFVLLGDNKAALWQAKSQIERCLAALRLRMHGPQSTVKTSAAGIPFLGHVVFPHRRRLKARNVRSMRRRLRYWANCFSQGQMRLEQISPRVRGWAAHAGHADMEGIRRHLLDRPFRASTA